MNTKTTLTPLVPPDMNQCQAEHKEGCWPDAEHFMIIGPGKIVRCHRKASFIITEVKPGKDGRIGSMSLCNECLAIAIERLGNKSFTAKPIK
jgi:hypothetical protein